MRSSLHGIGVPVSERLTRRRILKAVSAGAVALANATHALPTFAQPSDLLPGTPLGVQLTWVLAQINGAVSTITPADVTTHFSPSLLAVLPIPDVINALKELAKKGPFAFRAFSDIPMPASAVALVSSPVGKIYELHVEIEATAPSRITAVLLVAVPEVAYSATALAAVPGAVALDSDSKIMVNSLNQVVAAARFAGDVWGTVMWEDSTATRLTGPNGANIFEPQYLDASGQVLASWRAPNQATHACVWQDGQFRDLQPLPGGRDTRAFGGHDGVVIGWSMAEATGEMRAVKWVNGQPEPLAMPPGASSSAAIVTNATGQVAGYATRDDGTNVALLWDENGFTELGPLAESPDSGFPGTSPDKWSDMFPNPFPPLIGLNDQGQAAWTSTTDQGEWRASFWDNGATIDLGILAGVLQTRELFNSAVTAIGDSGQVVGWSEDLSHNFKPFLWHDETLTDLGVLPGGTTGAAVAIGGFARIVGWSDATGGHRHAVIWGEWGETQLAELPGDVASEASAINDHGHVAGWSYDSSQTAHAVIWKAAES